MENIIHIVLAVMLGVAVISLAIYFVVAHNRTQRVQNAGGDNNQQNTGNTFGSCRTGYDVVFRVVNMPVIPAEAQLVPRRNLCWIVPVLVALFLLMLFFIYLAARLSNATTAVTPAVTQQQQQSNQPVINPPLDPKTIVSPVNNKIDETGKMLAGKIDSVNQNLTAHRKSAGKGYTNIVGKLDKISTGVGDNGKKLDGISKQIADLDASITALRGELSMKVNELKTLLANNATTDDLNSLTQKINDLRSKVESLEKQKKQLSAGDPD